MIHLQFHDIQLQLKQNNNQTFVFDSLRKKWLLLTPEEHVRQMFIHFLIHKMNYPQTLFAIEKKITIGKSHKRFDILIYNRNHQPWMLIECKEPSVPISQSTLFQLLNYQQTINARYWLLTNGHQTFCADALDKNNPLWLTALPPF